MYLLPHITPELIVLKHSVECGEHPRNEGGIEPAAPMHQPRAGLWSRLRSIFS